MAKRKRSAAAAASSSVAESSLTDLPRNSRKAVPLPQNVARQESKPLRCQPLQRACGVNSARTNPNASPDVLDGITALRPSPDGGERVGGSGGSASAYPDAYATTEAIAAHSPADAIEHGHDGQQHGSTIGDCARIFPGFAKDAVEPAPGLATDDQLAQDPSKNKRQKGRSMHAVAAVEEDVGVMVNPETDEGRNAENEDEEEVKEALTRPPPVNSICLYHGKGKELELANARDVIKTLRWNDKDGTKFMRLSSEMFPFASHDEYGYKFASFAADTLREVGKVVAELVHRVTTQPGQFTQLGSPRIQVINASIRDLAYHDEMLSLLKLPANKIVAQS
ncbi:UvdE-domain-containing protein [Zopfia rhizophila CBS 207.26]|uniref:UvdE-domain-containing protein n=1 Tax=Zopfia rhizophila CBS 207.26 TaxID=1314779 RepID=A0A6A6EL36_9PEZI|nr:UvdE-domain-containing protein [Zopfia rhizophila CBS 207.26]